MRRQGLTKLQLLLLFGAVGLVLWRSSSRSSEIEGVIVLAGLEENRVYQAGLRVDRDTEVVVSMNASFETDATSAPIATYGWILDAEDRSLVWRPDRSSMTRDGVLGIVSDTIHIAAGLYEVYYTTVGPTPDSRSNAPFLGLKPYWTNDSSKWFMSVAAGPRENIDDLSIHAVDMSGNEAQREELLWATGQVGNYAANTHLFRVSAPAELSVYAIGEICTRECDFGYIEDVRGDERIWEMTWDNTVPAGGFESNRLYSGKITLKPGIYRAGFQSNGSHSAKKWRANPPWDPAGWGMILSNVPRSDVMSYDPWTQTEPLINLTGVGDDALEKAQFKVHAPSTFLISAMGEITSRRSVYDYGWLERNETRETIWKMSYLNSNHAGGDVKNRVETVFLDLEPGTYTVYYQSDDSHSFGHFNEKRPDHPERWGLALFPVAAEGSAEGAFTLLNDSWTTEQSLGEDVEKALYRNRGKTLLVSFERVGNDIQLSESFTLDDSASLYVFAAGELSTSGRYDYGWIERADSGERAWEMTVKNTVHAGGKSQNRRFEGLVQLPAGEYIARYVSDFSHAFGDFDEEGPDDRSEWGMRIFKLEH